MVNHFFLLFTFVIEVSGIRNVVKKYEGLLVADMQVKSFFG